MGKCMQVLTGYAVNPGAANTALTMAPGDSLTLDVFDPSARAELVSLWADNVTGGVVRVKSPRLHDNVQGYRIQIPAGDDLYVDPLEANQRVYPGDTLSVDTTGGAAETDIVSLLVYYQDVPGIDAPLKTWAEIQDRIVNLLGLQVNMVSGATAGQYSATRTLSQDYQVLKADVSYAVLGYTCASRCTTVGITGPDTGKVRVGGPGSIRTEDTSNWFANLSKMTGYATIPVIQALNAGATNIDIVAHDTATNHYVSFVLAELAG